ncbi:MAG TPA: TolC family protein, partial [Vicinamibacterales bacterium]|nr:TolC family protein [Vicinamibacterales bacterium]
FRTLSPLVLAAGILFSPPASAQQITTPPPPGQPPRSAPLAIPPGTFQGGVPSGTLTDSVQKISLIAAITGALAHNLGVLTAEQSLGKAEGARWRALGGLMPNVNARVGETRQTINLAAFGFSGGPGTPFAGIPTLVGPFNVFDARVLLSQSVLDFGALNSARAEAHNVEAARLTFRSARDFVIHVAGNLYVQVLAASARADAARAQQETARTLHQQALDLKQGGIIAGIDVLRAEVQLSTQTQRATIAANEFEKTKLQLARVIGLPLGQRFELDPVLPDLPVADLSIDAAVELAYKTRPDYSAALERISAAESARRSIVGDNLPSIRVNADYGEIGLSPSDARTTFSLTGAVNVPIFQGGKTKGRLLEADADIRNRQSEAEDLKAAIYYEIRAAFLDLDATARQLALAGKTRDLSAQQLTQARDRFAAGIANNVEVVQAQDAVAVATEQFIAAQYGYDLAKGALVRGVGTSEDVLRLLGGSR